MNDSRVELHALIAQQDCKVVPAWHASVCQLQTRAHVHAWLLVNLHRVHCRLACCIGSVAVHVEHTSVPRTLQIEAAAQTQQVAARPFRVWCFKCCRRCSAALCQTLALRFINL